MSAEGNLETETSVLSQRLPVYLGHQSQPYRHCLMPQNPGSAPQSDSVFPICHQGLIVFNGQSKADFTLAKVATKLQFIDFVFVLSLDF